MATHSKIANVAILATAGACLTTAWLLVHLLRRNANKDTFDDYEFKSSQHTIIEVPVPQKIVGSVIGRSGTNIKRIQDATSTRINFKNPDKDTNIVIAVIRGKPNDAQAAERLIRKLIAERLSITSTEIKILDKMCGILIGKGGANIRRITEISKARVTLETSASNEVKEFRTVTIKGTQAEIDYARALIDESLAKKKESKKGGSMLAMANKQIAYKDRQLAISEVGTAEVGEASTSRVQPLVPTGQDGFLQIFVSSAISPSLFWVQAFGVIATTLDKMVDQMTDFYEDSANWEDYKLETLEVGDIVAAPFPCDNAIYRGRILSVDVNDYDEDESEVRIYYVDFGGYAQFKRKDLYALHSDFVQLPFQAIECRLARVTPLEGTAEWSDEVCAEFNRLTHCAQWQYIMLRVVERERGVSADEGDVLVVEMVDTSGEVDIDVASELLQGRFASPSQGARGANDTPSVKSEKKQNETEELKETEEQKKAEEEKQEEEEQKKAEEEKQEEEEVAPAVVPDGGVPDVTE